MARPIPARLFPVHTMRRAALILVLIAATVAAAAAFLWPRGGEGGGQAAGRAKTVTVDAARTAPVEQRVAAVGTVRSADSVVVTAEAQGVVRELMFEDGARVRAGQVLARLDAEVERAELAAAEARAEQARSAFERARTLRARGAGTQTALEEAQAALRTADAELDLARARLEKRTVTAPFDGVLSFRQVSRGAYVQPGEALATLDAIATVDVDFRLPEDLSGRLDRGQAVTLRVRAHPDRTFRGLLKDVDTRIDPASRQIVARATVENPDFLLRPGMLAEVSLLLGSREGIVLPALAVVAIGPSHFVFVAGKDGTAERRPVGLGLRGPGTVEIASGLNPGEPVVVDGAAKLAEGDRIDARPVAESPVAPLISGQPQAPASTGSAAALEAP